MVGPEWLAPAHWNPRFVILLLPVYLAIICSILTGLTWAPEDIALEAATILIVDDNDIQRYALGRILETKGFSVMQANSGSTALESAKNSPDLILLDINLSDMTGFDVLRQLRADAETANIPVIFVSAGTPAAEARQRLLNHGASGFLTYPVHPDYLYFTIAGTLAKNGARNKPHPSASSVDVKSKER